MAKAAGQPKSPFLWRPRQRPTLQRRNVAEYLPEAQRHAVKFRMRAAYLMNEAVDARNALLKLHDQLVELNPSAAASLVEGPEER